MHKKIAVSIMLLYLVFSSMTTAVYAQPQLPSAGLTPDHPLYFLDRMFEGLELWFAEVVGGREGRARKMLEIAGERLSEMKAMAEQGKTQHIPSLVEDYRAKMNEATEIARRLNSTELYGLVAETTQHHQTILDEVYSRVPDEAKSAIQDAKEVSRKGHDEAKNALGKMP